MDAADWLTELGFKEYEPAFRENSVDMDLLPSLTSDDLKELGIKSVGHRKRLLDAIALLRNRTSASDDARPLSHDASATENLAILEAERRQLTVMFCDLVGSTALSRLDPEDLGDVIGMYHKCITQAVTRFNGFVARYMGGSVLAYFGYPEAHEDDAEQAVRAGLAVVESVRRLDTPDKLRVRVGIATGLVVVGDLIGSGGAQECSVVGETPNLAARLQTMAEPDTVVIAASTWRLAGGLFEYEDLGAVQAKGFAEPVRTWRVTGESATDNRFEAMHSAAALTPLVGREEEIELLLSRWHRAKSGDGQVVLLSGEPGIGKSRVTAAVQERIANEPHTRLHYFCTPHHQHSALHPVIAQLERAADFEREDSPDIKLGKLEALLAPTSPPGEDVALLAELLSIPTADRYPALDLTPERKKEKTFEALLRQLELLARRRPVLMVYEDVHWVDPTSREALSLTVEWARSWPILLLITLRPEFQPPWVGRAHITALPLNRLDRREGAALIQRVAGNAPLPSDVVEQIIERTDGVPLFVEELTKAVLEAGGSAVKAARSVSAAPLSALRVPPTLHASLMARLDRIGPIAKEVAQAAAVIGREFSYSLLVAAARRTDSELRAALDRLTGAELVFRRGTLPGATFLFKHALVQDAAYHTLLRSRRRELHARIARVLEEEPTTAAAAQPEILAYHCAKAGLTDKAISYWQKAGERSMARSAMVEAIAQIQEALDLLRDLPDAPDRQRTELELRLALGGALIATRGHAAEETGEAYARARHLCELLGDTANLLKALWGEFVHHHVRAETARSHRAAEELLRLAELQNDTAAMVAGHRAIGDSFLHLGHLGPARAHLERGLALYDPVQHRSLTLLFAENARVAMLSFLSLTLALLGFADQAGVRSREALAEARGLSHPISVAFALSVACRLYFVLQEPRGVRQLAEELISLTTEQRFAFFLAMGTTYRGWALVEAGDATTGMDALRSGIAGFRACGAEWILPFYLAQLATAHAKAGRVEDGLGRVSEAIGSDREIGGSVVRGRTASAQKRVAPYRPSGR